MTLTWQCRKSRQLRTVAIGLLIAIAPSIWAAEAKPRPETPVLGKEAYRTPLDEVIVTGRAQQLPPRWDKPKVVVPEEVSPSRLQLLPRYSGEERDEYDGVRDNQNPKPRTKLFELKF